MISFRSHVVSLLAVFLALAVGIVLGGGPLQREAGGEEAQTDDSAAAVAELEDEAERLRRAADFNDAYALATRDQLVPQDLLEGRSVALLTLPGADEGQVTDIASYASSVGATVAARVDLDDALVDVANRQLVEELGARLRASVGDAVDVPSTADGYQRMGLLLGYAVATQRPGGSAVDDVGSEILASLSTAGLVTSDSPVERRGALVLVVAGDPLGTPDQRRGVGRIVASLAQALDESAKGALVAGPTSSGARDGVVGAVRRSPAADDVSTVDVTDRVAGVVLTALALAAEDAGTTVHVGTSRARDGAFPTAVQPGDTSDAAGGG